MANRTVHKNIQNLVHCNADLSSKVFDVTLDADSGSRNTNAAGIWNCLGANKAENEYSDAQMNVLQEKAQTFNYGDTRRPKVCRAINFPLESDDVTLGLLGRPSWACQRRLCFRKITTFVLFPALSLILFRG
jgi:hypothetical protein